MVFLYNIFDNILKKCQSSALPLAKIHQNKEDDVSSAIYGLCVLGAILGGLVLLMLYSLCDMAKSSRGYDPEMQYWDAIAIASLQVHRATKH